MSHESLYHGPTGLVVSKGCRYLEQLDKTIGKMVQAGLPEHLFMMGVSSRLFKLRRRIFPTFFKKIFLFNYISVTWPGSPNLRGPPAQS